MLRALATHTKVNEPPMIQPGALVIGIGVHCLHYKVKFGIKSGRVLKLFSNRVDVSTLMPSAKVGEI